ncbi:hypothetical protein ACFQ2B_31115 [Streptomyces stramineus]
MLHLPGQQRVAAVQENGDAGAVERRGAVTSGAVLPWCSGSVEAGVCSTMRANSTYFIAAPSRSRSVRRMSPLPRPSIRRPWKPSSVAYGSQRAPAA